MPINKLLSSGVIPAGQSWTSAPFVVDGLVQGGFLSLQLAVSGDGAVKAEVLCRNDPDGQFVIPEGASAIMLGKPAGNYLASFEVPACLSFKVRLTETGGANAVTVTATLAMV